MKICVESNTVLTHNVIVSGVEGGYRWWVRQSNFNQVMVHVYGYHYLPLAGSISVDFPYDGLGRLMLTPDRGVNRGWRAGVLHVAFGTILNIPSMGGYIPSLRVMRQWLAPACMLKEHSFVPIDDVEVASADAAMHICRQLDVRRDSFDAIREA